MVPNNTEEFLIFKIIKFLLDDDDDDNDDDDNDNEISDRRKIFFRNGSPSQISDMWRAGSEPAQNLSFSCALVNCHYIMVPCYI